MKNFPSEITETKLSALALFGYTIENEEYNDFIFHNKSAVAVLQNDGKWFVADPGHESFLRKVLGEDRIDSQHKISQS
jgi:hypothetical protein